MTRTVGAPTAFSLGSNTLKEPVLGRPCWGWVLHGLGGPVLRLRAPVCGPVASFVGGRWSGRWSGTGGPLLGPVGGPVGARWWGRWLASSLCPLRG